MAYTSVIPVRRLDRTVDYVQNKAKTTPKSLEEAVDYAANRDKTESACFETGLGCTTTSAFEDMRLNTLRWHKETGVQGYHLVQSFAEGEVTPELAHQIGVEFAEQLLHGKYQAIVTTHLNTKHYHNHIVWSAVSLEDGKKYHSNSKSYYTEVRALSDSLCQKYGLSIIETPESLRGKRQYEKWRAEENNKSTWRTLFGRMWTKQFNKALHGGNFLLCWSVKGMKSDWDASILSCAHPERSALFDSKRWARGIPPKQSRRASCIHEATALMLKIHQQSNMAVCAAASHAAS